PYGGKDSGRRGARARQRAARRGSLRRAGAAAGGQLHGLCDAARRRLFAHRDRPPRDAVDVEPAGAEGVGESGTLPVAAVIASAVEDALAERGMTVERAPLTPAVVRGLQRS